MKTEKSINSNLVIVRAGQDSLHRLWLHGDRSFDLYVVAYEPIPKIVGESHIQSFLYPGNKVAGLGMFFQDHWETIRQYTHVAILDDDILCSAEDINRCFRFGQEYRLCVWQPSLSWDSYFSHAITINHPIFRLRYTNFVEMMCPFFTIESLRLVVPTFSLGLESAIDQIWPQIEGIQERGCAIIDAIIVRHTRKVGKFKSSQGFVGEFSEYNLYLDAAQRIFSYSFVGAISYAGVLSSGRIIRSRLLMSILCLTPIVGVLKSVNRGWFLRPIINHSARNLISPLTRNKLEIKSLEKSAKIWKNKNIG